MCQFNQYQLRILLSALDSYRGDIAADLNGWTIGDTDEKNDIENLCTTTQLDVEIATMREALSRQIH